MNALGIGVGDLLAASRSLRTDENRRERYIETAFCRECGPSCKLQMGLDADHSAGINIRAQRLKRDSRVAQKDVQSPTIPAPLAQPT